MPVLDFEIILTKYIQTPTRMQSTFDPEGGVFKEWLLKITHGRYRVGINAKCVKHYDHFKCHLEETLQSTIKTVLRFP